MLVLGFHGTSVPGELLSFAERFGLGGVILFSRNCPDGTTVQALTRDLRRSLAEADPGGRPLIFVDQEGGRVERIRDRVPHLPPALELGKMEETRVGELVGEQARALDGLGIDVNLAPVCDVLQEGESGAIGDRSFGADPDRVARLAAAHVRATLAAGIIPCAKHFPGHGAAREDSHKSLPQVGKRLDMLRAVDLVPFAAALAAGVPLVLAAHAVFPSLAGAPASLSGAWLEGVLRREMGFRGAVISDDMEMGALRGIGSPGEVALEAVRAGCDLLIYSRGTQPDWDIASVAQALERDLAPGRIEEAIARREALKVPNRSAVTR